MTTPATPLPRKFQRAAKKAERQRAGQFDAEIRRARAELAARPAPATRDRVPLRDRELLPVKPAWALDPKAEIAWLRSFTWNRVKHHFWRLDLHARTFWCAAGRGAARVARSGWDWIDMVDGALALARIETWASKEHYEEHSARYHKKKTARRSTAATFAGAIALGLAVALAVLVPAFGWGLGVAVIAFALFLILPPPLALIGRKRGKKGPQVMQLDARPVPKIEGRPTGDMVHDAFLAAGIPDITWEMAPHRAGPGWEMVVRIPIGKQTFADAVKAHAGIAGNLGIPSSCLYLSPVRGNGGSEKHVRVWWTKTDPFAGDLAPHPVLDPKNGPVDLWNGGLPIGLDARGTIAKIAVVDTPFMVIGGQPGAGKTFLLFGFCAAIAADPIWDLDVWSFKPSNDFGPVEPLVKAGGGTFRYGADQKTFDAFLKYLRALRSEIVARNERLADLPIERNRNAKVERDVAADPACGMRPRIVIADEIQTALVHPGVLAELIEIGRVARSQNVVMVLGMQFVDSETIEQLQRLLGTRICLSVARVEDSRGVLGGAHEPGIAEGHKIPLTSKAVAILDGAIEDPEIGPRPAFKIRSFKIDRQLLADHVTACLAGPRSGQATARVDLEKPDVEVAAWRAKIAAAFHEGETALTCTVLGERLGLGERAVAARELARVAKNQADVKPQRDTSGNVTGHRGALYLSLDQLT